MVPVELEWVERFTGSYVVDVDPGREHLVVIAIRCIGALRDLARGRASVVGSIRAPGLCAIASLVGEVSLERGPVVRYAMQTTGDAGAPLFLALERGGFRRDAYAGATTLVGEARGAEGAHLASLRLRVDVRGGALVSGLRWRG